MSDLAQQLTIEDVVLPPSISLDLDAFVGDLPGAAARGLGLAFLEMYAHARAVESAGAIDPDGTDTHTWDFWLNVEGPLLEVLSDLPLDGDRQERLWLGLVGAEVRDGEGLDEEEQAAVRESLRLLNVGKIAPVLPGIEDTWDDLSVDARRSLTSAAVWIIAALRLGIITAASLSGSDGSRETFDALGHPDLTSVDFAFLVPHVIG